MTETTHTADALPEVRKTLSLEVEGNRYSYAELDIVFAPTVPEDVRRHAATMACKLLR